MIHELKMWPEYFEKVISGEKTFEIRKNDRPFNVGDLLALNEYDLENGYTGNSCLVYVDYILFNSAYFKDDYVAMSIKPCSVWKHDRPVDQFKIKPEYGVPLVTRKDGADNE